MSIDSIPAAEPPAVEPLVQGSLSAQAYRHLREAFISGRFRPGQRLKMQDLADQLGTSITPVREACMRLVSEGGLELRSGRFAEVPAMTLDRYMEVRMMRLELEGLAAELAAGRATPDDIARLEATQEPYRLAETTGDAEAASRANRDFHFAVFRMSGRKMLISHLENLWVSMGPMLNVLFTQVPRRYFGHEAHAAVIAAMRAGDGAAARAALQRDILEAGEDFIGYLSDHPEYCAA